MAAEKKITVTFSINYFLVIFGVAVVMIALYIWGPPDWRPALVFGGAMLAAGAALVNAANALDARGSQAHQSRIQAAMAAIHSWNSPSFYHCKKNCRAVIDHFKTHPHVPDQLTYLGQNPEAHANLIDVLNHFEALSIGITRDVIHEETAKQFFRSMIIQYWQTTKPYIENKRAERQNPRLQKEFEALYERWKG